MKGNRRKNLINAFILAAYVAAHLVFISHHEAWGDEAQAWVIAKNTTLPELFKALCAEGHPAGWFLVIKLAQVTGLSFRYFSLLSLLLMTAAVALLLWSSPFPAWQKIVVLLSSAFCYFNPVISRVYSLTVLTVILLARFYEERYEKPVLFGLLTAVLFQTHVIMAGMAGGLMLALLRRSFSDKKVLPGALISLAGFAATFAELFPRSGVDKSVEYSADMLLSGLTVENALEGLKIIPERLFTWLPGVFTALLLVLLALVIACAIYRFSVYDDILFISACSVGFIAVVSIFLYRTTIHAATMLPLIAVFIYWISYDRAGTKFSKAVSVAFICVLCVGTYRTWFRSARSDYLRDFSENKRMADYISTNLEENSVIIFKDEELARVGVYAYVTSDRGDIVFYCPDTDDEYGFFDWSVTTSPISNEEAYEMARAEYGRERKYYLLSWKEEDGTGLEAVFAADEFCEKNDPSYLYIYKEANGDE